MFFSIEWLNTELKNIADAKLRQQTLILWLTSASDYLVDDCRRINQELYDESLKTGDEGLKAFSLLYLAYYHRMRGDREMGEKDFREAEKIMMQLKPSFEGSIVCQMVAFEYWTSGQRDKAFELSYYGLKLGENVGAEGIGWARFQLGVFHFDLKDYATSLNYFLEAESNSIENNLPYQLARCRSGIAGNYIAKGELDEADQYSKLALEGYRTCGHKTAISRALNDLGVISFQRSDLKNAENYLRESLALREELNYAAGITTSRMELARVLLADGNLEEAETVLQAAMELCIRTDAQQKTAACHNLLYELYKMRKDPWKALEHLEKYFSVKAIVDGAESSNRIKHLQQKYATEKSDQEAEIHRLKNVELKKASAEIEEKNKSILDSIRYAKRIQSALMPSEKFIEKAMNKLRKK